MKSKFLSTKLSAIVCFAVIMVSCSLSGNLKLNVIPAPFQVNAAKGGDFILNDSTVFVATTPEAVEVAEFYSSKIARSAGFDLKIQSEPVTSNGIVLKINSEGFNPECYSLSSDSKKIFITSGDKAGLFYGMATFMQLLPPEIESGKVIENADWRIPSLNITDIPRFKYRGIHLDVSRHFMSVDEIKKTINVLSQYKINNIHLHLTDDQGWRIEIKKYPLLTVKGSTRVEGEGFVHEGFYTQEELKELVKYAQIRSVNLVPEIEMPGHSLAAISAYPELSCKGEKTTPRIIWGVEEVILCAGKESVFQFVDDVIAEVAEIFPSPYIHIGGDEAPKASWQKCPLCQKRIDEKGLRDGEDGYTPEERLQGYFIKRAEKIAEKYGKRIIGWDEILEGGLPESAIVMSWRGTEGGIIAASQGHEVIMTPSTDGLYFDYYQGDSRVEPVGIGGFAPLEKTYSYNPVPDTLVKLNMQDYIIGVQANHWSEYFYDNHQMEYMLYPRALALAEVAWSKPERKDFKDFCRRLDGDASARLDYSDVAYHIPIPEQPGRSCDRVAFVNNVRLFFKTTRPMRIVYTIDGSEPDRHSMQYHKPLMFNKSATLKICSVLPTGKCSPVRTIYVTKEKYRPAIEVENPKQGLLMKVADGMFLTRSDMKAGTDENSWKTFEINSPQDLTSYRPANGVMRNFPYYAAVGEGYIMIPEDGVYYFSSNFNDVSIDGEMIIDNDGLVKKSSAHSEASIALEKGFHHIKTTFLDHIIGGYPSGWDGGDIYIKKSDEKEYKLMMPEMFWHSDSGI